MKKVGIITMYYNSTNYGGTLQSYALQKTYDNMGVKCLQIQFKKENNNEFGKMRNYYKRLGAFKTIKKVVVKLPAIIEKKIANIMVCDDDKRQILNKNKKFEEFRNIIPHTNNVYTSGNIIETNNLFDVFICGSDQIWKPGVFCDEYALTFVGDGKKKYSYAASISKNNISKKEIGILVEKISSFDGVSLREESDIEILNSNSNMKAKFVLDPTLLLDKNDWDRIACPIEIKDEYIFCYLLGMNKKVCKSIKNIAMKNNLKIVNLKFANGIRKVCEINFGDYQLIDVGPEEFIYLIKNAKLVLTDSFHASAFSIIYNKNFYVVDRPEEKSMNTRIESLLEIFEIKDRYININNLDNVNLENKQDIVLNKYKSVKKTSLSFLKDTVKEKK